MRKLLLASVAFFGVTLPAVATQNSPLNVTVVDGPVLIVTDKSRVYTDSQEIYVVIDVMLQCTNSIGVWPGHSATGFTLKLFPFDKHPPLPMVATLQGEIPLRIIPVEGYGYYGNWKANFESKEFTFEDMHICWGGEPLHVAAFVQYFATK